MEIPAGSQRSDAEKFQVSFQLCFDIKILKSRTLNFSFPHNSRFRIHSFKFSKSKKSMYGILTYYKLHWQTMISTIVGTAGTIYEVYKVICIACVKVVAVIPSFSYGMKINSKITLPLDNPSQSGLLFILANLWYEERKKLFP